MDKHAESIILDVAFVDKLTCSKFLNYNHMLWKIIGIVEGNKYLLKNVSREILSDDIKVISTCPKCGFLFLKEESCCYCSAVI